MGEDNISKHLKITWIIYSALISGQILIFIIVLILVENSVIESIQNLDEILRYMIPVIGFIAMILSHRLYLINISNINTEKEMLSRLRKYRSCKIVQWLLIEAASLISLVGFFITGNYLHAVIFLFLLGFFILSKPSMEQLRSDCKINIKN